MSKIYKTITSLFILMSVTFMLTTVANASIFSGLETKNQDGDTKAYGLCVNYDHDLTKDSPKYIEECKNVKCDDPKDSNYDDVFCVSEAKAGVEATKSELSSTGITHTDTLGVLIVKYVNFALPYLTLAAFLAFVYAGILYVTAYGNDENLEKAKKIMIYAAIGLILIIASYSIVSFLTTGLVEQLT